MILAVDKGGYEVRKFVDGITLYNYLERLVEPN